MRIKIATKVQQDIKTVFDGFDQRLFMRLAPPFPPFRLMRFDGCKKGDEVHIKLWNFGWQDWIAHITDDFSSENQIGFVDVGFKLPSFIKSWKHQHIIQNNNGESVIIDNIQFTCHSKWFEYLLYPLFYLQFAYRIPIYKRVFSRK